MKEKDLLRLKDKVDSAQATGQQLKGQKKAILEQLDDDFDCKTTKAAKKKVKELKSNIADVDNEIDKEVKVIEEKYMTD